MDASNSKCRSIISQPDNQGSETKAAITQVLIELDRLKAEDEKQYLEQLKQLKEELQKLDEEKAIMDKAAVSASPIVKLNVGGEKMSTSRATLTLAEGSSLATMFSGNSEDKLTKEPDGDIFLDFDPVLFKCLLNQLRSWSNSSVKRVFRPPVGLEQSFLEFVRSLEFDERYIDGETSIIKNDAKNVQPKQEVQQSINNESNAATNVPEVAQSGQEVQKSINGETNAATNVPEVAQPGQEVQKSINGETNAATNVPEVAQPGQEVQKSINGETNAATNVPEVAQPGQEVQKSINGETSAATSVPEGVQPVQVVQQSINNETNAATSVPAVVQSVQKIESFRTEYNSDVKLTDNHRRCEKITLKPDWQSVLGTLDYSTGIHKIRLKLEKGSFDIMFGICSRNKQPTGPYFYDKPTTHGWLINAYVIKNGQSLQQGWSQVDENQIIELTINCNEKSLSILNENSRKEDSMQVDTTEAPFPWCLLVLLHYKTSRVSLV